MKVCSVEEIRSLEKRAATELGISDRVAMEHAGIAACDVIRRETSATRFVILCGLGNNGGIGFVVARKLHADGARVRVFLFGDPSSLEDAILDSFEAARRSGVRWDQYDDHDELRTALHGSPAVIDGLLSTGLEGDVSGDLAEAIALANQCSGPVISLDIPSGVCADTGQVRGTAVRAQATITFGLPKRGNVLPPGSSRVGRLYVSHVGLSPELQQDERINVELVTPARIGDRAAHGHKGSFGDILIIAGAAAYFGAPSLAAMACLRAGAGYVRLACPQSMAPTIAALAPEVVLVPQRETDGGSIARDNLVDLLTLAKEVDFVIIGPGISLHATTQDLVRELVAGIDKPILIDGDGITAIAKDASIVRGREARTVLTPHPGEMARLLSASTRKVVSDPVVAAVTAVQRFEAHIVLKGANTVVAQPDGRVTVNTTGNSGMGTAGSGDVLTGTIAALYGLGLRFTEAVTTGVFVHGLAGDLARDELGADGMTARDILNRLPAAMRALREQSDRYVSGSYGVTVV